MMSPLVDDPGGKAASKIRHNKFFSTNDSMMSKVR